MAYDDDELSQAAGEPVELFEFAGSLLTWRYASGAQSVVHAGHTFSPLAGLERGGIQKASSKDSPTLTVRLPASAGVVVSHGLAVPPRSLSLTVYRYQQRSGGYVVAWSGPVTTIVPRGAMAEVKCPSLLGARLSVNVSGLALQHQCQHRLGDARCRVDLSGMTVSTTVSSVSGSNVSVASFGGHPSQWFRAGEIVRDSDGERRTILYQAVSLVLHAPFRELNHGDAVKLYPGCDHTEPTCRTKFTNGPNYSGFWIVPDGNPFKTRIPFKR